MKTQKSRLFCSMFVVACYQAASDSNAVCEQFISRDAIHCTPLDLYVYLRFSKAWVSGDYA